MPGRTRIEITESDEELQLLELRLTMLRLMKQQPDISQKELAAQLDVSERTVRRWQTEYREGGIANFFGSTQQKPTSEDDYRRLLHFLNALPCRGTVDDLSADLADVLKELFGDVDSISIAVDRCCDLNIPDEYAPGMIVFQQQTDAGERIDVQTMPDDEDLVASLVESMEASGFDLNAYHPPSGFVFRFGGSAILGIILLWREKGNPPISLKTIARMEEMRSFLVYVLSDIVARHAFARPLDRIFLDVVRDITLDADLAPREREALLHVLRGSSYEETAAAMGISREGVKMRLREVYGKTGTTGLPQLVGKYFTPRMTRTGSSESNRITKKKTGK